MARVFNKEDTYKVNLEINKDEILKDIREIKKETETIIKDAEYNINKLRLKRKDLHRKVLVLDNSVRDIEVAER